MNTHQIAHEIAGVLQNFHTDVAKWLRRKKKDYPGCSQMWSPICELPALEGQNVYVQSGGYHTGHESKKATIGVLVETDLHDSMREPGNDEPCATAISLFFAADGDLEAASCGKVLAVALVDHRSGAIMTAWKKGNGTFVVERNGTPFKKTTTSFANGRITHVVLATHNGNREQFAGPNDLLRNFKGRVRVECSCLAAVMRMAEGHASTLVDFTGSAAVQLPVYAFTKALGGSMATVDDTKIADRPFSERRVVTISSTDRLVVGKEACSPTKERAA